MISAMMLLNGCGKADNSEKEANEVMAAENESYSTELETEKNIEETSKPAIETAETVTEDATEVKEEVEQKTDSVIDEQFEDILDNIVFIGDSVTSGFSGYQKVSMSQVFAKPCVGPSNIRDFSFDYSKDEFAALTILSYEKPEHIVISMGLNDINTYSPENFSELYMDFVEDAMVVCPDAQFYIMSITPVSSSCKNITNETIDNANMQLEKTVSDYASDKLHYVNCADALKGDNGNMNEDYSGGDGIHLNSGAYDVILEQLRNSIA